MTLDGTNRRNSIVHYLEKSTKPINGTELAKIFGVSRQIIVQDVALLRAENRNILSTNKGYVLFQPQTQRGGFTSVIRVKHTMEQTLAEMQSVVDYGGCMLDVFVEHDLYGQIRVDLLINDMQDAEDFCAKMIQCKSRPLKELTDDYHYHTINAPSEKALDLIRKELKEKGFLVD